MKKFCFRQSWERLRRAPCSRGFGVQSPSDYRFITETLRGVLPETVCEALPSDAERAKFCRLVYLVCAKYKPQRVANFTDCAEIDAVVRLAKADCDVSRPSLEQIRAGQSATFAADVLIADAELLASATFQQPVSLKILENLASPSRIIVANIHASGAAFRAWKELTKVSAATVSFDLYSSGVLLVDRQRWRAEYSLWF